MAASVPHTARLAFLPSPTSVAAGGVSGVILAAWRSQPVAFYAGTMGLNYGLFGGTYFSM